MSLTIMQGDALEQLRLLPDASVDSVVTDPPYHLTTGKKGGSGAASVNLKSPAGRAKVSTGFMGMKWDGGDIAHRVELWAEALRVLKPGGHLLSFAATRTYHRMVCAIEDAGFEIRDQIGWLYGSGFPKSLDVSKAIDKANGRTSEAVTILKAELRRVFEASGLTLAALNERCGFEASGYLRTSSTWATVMPSPERWRAIREAVGCDDDFSDDFLEAEREVVGKAPWTNSASHFVPGEDHARRVHLDITAPATPAAEQWQGWGTALKPAWEPIVLARKAIEGTVAGNVLAHGTGAINVNACRVEMNGEDTLRPEGKMTSKGVPGGAYGRCTERPPTGRTAGSDTGRWPPNVIHDGSEEVLACFPQTTSGRLLPTHDAKESGNGSMSGKNYAGRIKGQFGGDTGSAARFFYSAKASGDEREDNPHATVKPLALMRYLVRLITPPGGTVLDLFAGSGSTLIAAKQEGFSAIGIEIDPAHVAIIKARLGKELL